jgi:hypothetical protein
MIQEQEIVHEGTLPAMPVSTSPAPRRTRGWKWVAIGAGAVVVLGGLGIASRGDSVAENLGREAAPVVQDAVPSDDVYDEAITINDAVIGELDAAANSATEQEIAEHLYTAADLVQTEAALFVGTDETLVSYLTSAAGHYNASADALMVEDYDTAMSELDAATADIDAATKTLS